MKLTEREQLIDTAERLTERLFNPPADAERFTPEARAYFDAKLAELTTAAAVLSEVGYAPSEAIYAIRGLKRARQSFTAEEYPDELHTERLSAAYILLAVPQEQP
jgi:hypothetical protein